jgi:hypothetical protein
MRIAATLWCGECMNKAGLTYSMLVQWQGWKPLPEVDINPAPQCLMLSLVAATLNIAAEPSAQHVLLLRCAVEEYSKPPIQQGLVIMLTVLPVPCSWSKMLPHQGHGNHGRHPIVASHV